MGDLFSIYFARGLVLADEACGLLPPALAERLLHAALGSNGIALQYTRIQWIGPTLRSLSHGFEWELSLEVLLRSDIPVWESFEQMEPDLLVCLKQPAPNSKLNLAFNLHGILMGSRDQVLPWLVYALAEQCFSLDAALDEPWWSAGERTTLLHIRQSGILKWVYF